MQSFTQFCETAKSQKQENRPTAAGRGYSYRWQKESGEYLKQHSKCVRCGGKAKLVHHIKPHNGNQKLFWDKRNWQSLCNKCHSN